jgi:hypothetical protein
LDPLKISFKPKNSKNKKEQGHVTGKTKATGKFNTSFLMIIVSNTHLCQRFFDSLRIIFGFRLKK